MPENAEAIIHGHYDTPQGMVDKPELNNGYGDTDSLRGSDPKPTFTVTPDGKIGVHEMQSGRVQFTYPQGALTPRQEEKMQQNLNEEQKRFQR